MLANAPMSTPDSDPGPTRSASAFATTGSTTVVDRVHCDDAAGPGAGLTAKPEGALHDQRGRGVDVHVVGNHDRVLATHLQLDAAVGSDLAVNEPAHPGGAGERHRRHPGILGHGRTDRAVALHQGDNIRRQPAGQQCLDEAWPINGVTSDGLNSTGLPAASAGPSLRDGMLSGKFHGVIAPTMPTGSRSVNTRLAPAAG